MAIVYTDSKVQEIKALLEHVTVTGPQQARVLVLLDQCVAAGESVDDKEIKKEEKSNGK